MECVTPRWVTSTTDWRSATVADQFPPPPPPRKQGVYVLYVLFSSLSLKAIGVTPPPFARDEMLVKDRAEKRVEEHRVRCVA